MTFCKFFDTQFFFSSSSTLTIFLKALALIILYALLWNSILSYFNVEGIDNETVKEFSGVIKVLLIFMVAPVTETLLFQSLIIFLVLEYYRKRNKYYVAIIMSTILFSLTHIFSIYYFLYAIGLGLGFAIFYVIMQRRKSNPIILTMLLHASFNATGYFLSPLFE